MQRWAWPPRSPPCPHRRNFGGTRFHRTQYGNFLIDTRDFRHLGLELWIPPLQVVAHLVRLHLLLGEELANRALRDPRQAGVPRRRTMLAAMTGQHRVVQSSCGYPRPWPSGMPETPATPLLAR